MDLWIAYFLPHLQINFMIDLIAIICGFVVFGIIRVVLSNLNGKLPRPLAAGKCLPPKRGKNRPQILEKRGSARAGSAGNGNTAVFRMQNSGLHVPIIRHH